MNRKVSIVAALLLTCVFPVHASLGEQAKDAKARGVDYAQRFEARTPKFEIDGAGVVIMECWVAPSRLWTEKEAIALAKELLPPRLKNAEPKALATRGGLHQLFAFDGVTALLRLSERGRFLSVEVRTDSYKGPTC